MAGNLSAICGLSEVGTSPETHLYAFTACYRNSFTFMCIYSYLAGNTSIGLQGLLRESVHFIYVYIHTNDRKGSAALTTRHPSIRKS
jgi:hypothetical protein